MSLTSCASGPAAVRPPDIDADASAEKALELYDSDHSGVLEAAELKEVPGLAASVQTVDTNKDSQISAEEIAERIRTWQASRIGVATVMCNVAMDGRALVGATVTFEPESFLGEYVQAGVATTNDLGSAFPSVPEEKRPTSDTPHGMQLGFYRVKISKMANGEETIPTMYNKATTLGQQIAPDDPAVMSRKISFDLKSR
jgi:hypothetical protein